ncbi:hypothetical protein AAFF_G00376800 [Aldrovandia affinis]|uniref:CGG triplet repeat-binding protein 1 n=1 Tax=Aldrovandia affinis TaxID=143900 RepID=A0AAD7SFN9_9TELE|nr:hypothetical protein AAFF_G00376800 [Aldrovandia affinis]
MDTPFTNRRVTLSERVEQYPKGTLFEDGKNVFCKTCNLTVDHTRKIAVDRHLLSQRHLKRKAENEGEVEATDSQRGSESAERRGSVVYDLTHAFVCANIPLEKVDNPALRAFLKKHVTNGGAIPTASQLRKEYLPKVVESHKNQLQAVIQSAVTDSNNHIVSQQNTPGPNSDCEEKEQ